MTHGLSKDIQCHVWPYSFLCLHITRSDIMPHKKWAVSLVIADGHLIFLTGLCKVCRYVWVNMVTRSRERDRERGERQRDRQTTTVTYCVLCEVSLMRDAIVSPCGLHSMWTIGGTGDCLSAPSPTRSHFACNSDSQHLKQKNNPIGKMAQKIWLVECHKRLDWLDGPRDLIGQMVWEIWLVSIMQSAPEA